MVGGEGMAEEAIYEIMTGLLESKVLELGVMEDLMNSMTGQRGQEVQVTVDHADA